MAITVKLGSGSVLSANLGGGSVITANIGGGSTLIADMGEGATTPPGPGYCPEYQLVYDSWTNKPINPQDTYQNTWVETLVAASLWTTKKDVQYNFAIHSNNDGEAQTNWLNPGTYDCTAVNAPTFTAYEGFTGDGATSYLDTNWNPNSNGVNFSLISNSFGLYSRTDLNESKYECGVNVTRLILIATRIAGVFRIFNNSVTYGQVAVTDSLGMFISNRSAHNDHDGYKNGNKVFDDVDVAFNVPSANMYILCRNNNGTPANHSNKQVSCFFAGGEMAASISTETTAFETYMDSNSRGVIP